MTRKLVLVGIILVFGRGSVLQLSSALFIATAFTMSHIHFRPFKLPLDNLLRFTTELHTVITIMTALTIKADAAVQSQQSVYDHVLVDTFTGLVVLPFVAVAIAKVMTVRKLMKQALEAPEAQKATTGDVHMAMQRFQLGLESAADRELVTAYFDSADHTDVADQEEDEAVVPPNP